MCDIKRICERVARQASKGLRSLCEVRKGRLERLEQVLIRLLLVCPEERSGQPKYQGSSSARDARTSQHAAA
jgi:hypothetical protein